MEMLNMGRRLRSAGGRQRRRRQIFAACAFAIAAAVGINEPAFVVAALALADDTVNGDVVALGGESSMLFRRLTRNEEEEEGNAATEEAHDDDHHRSLWLKEFLSNHLKRKPTSSPTSTMVVVSAPLTSQKPTTSKPTTFKSTTSTPTAPPTDSPNEVETLSPESDYPTMSPIEEPTLSPETEYPTWRPNEEPTNLPTKVPTTNVVSSSPTSMKPTVLMTPPKTFSFYPAKFDNVIYCMHGDLADPWTLSNMPPANDERFTTMCECCAKEDIHNCLDEHKAECGLTTATTSKPTAHIPTMKPSFKSTTLPQLWLYYPVKFDNTLWCVFGDHNDVSFLKSMPPASNETYKTKCECCSIAHHECIDLVKKECAHVPTTSSPIMSSPITASPTTSKPVSSKPVSFKPVSSKPVSSKPISLKPMTPKPTTSNPTMSKITTMKPTTSKSTTFKPTLPKPPKETEMPTYSPTMDEEIPTYSPTYGETER